jgi:hypothetical protein
MRRQVACVPRGPGGINFWFTDLWIRGLGNTGSNINDLHRSAIMNTYLHYKDWKQVWIQEECSRIESVRNGSVWIRPGPPRALRRGSHYSLTIQYLKYFVHSDNFSAQEVKIHHIKAQPINWTVIRGQRSVFNKTKQLGPSNSKVPGFTYLLVYFLGTWNVGGGGTHRLPPPPPMVPEVSEHGTD